MKNSKYLDLCVKALSGEITPKEKTELDRWLKMSPENQNFYFQIEKTWQSAEPQMVSEIPDIDKEWSFIEESLGLRTEKSKKKAFLPVFENLSDKLAGLAGARYRTAFAASAAVIILAIGLFVWKTGSHYQKITTRNKQKIEFKLPDGSYVHLNNGSSIKFSKIFSDSLRQVILDGEAFFKITHNERPFTVLTQNAKITVLGTQFNIWARKEETRVIVKQGQVRLNSITENNGSVVLAKNQMSRIIKEEYPQKPETVNADHLIGWLKGILVFERTPLIEIVSELERYYDVSIRLEDSQLSQKTITATFDNSPIETVLSSICLTLSAQYKFHSGKYILEK